MSPIKMLALDIDGTILAKDSPISDFTKEIIAEAAKKGVKVILATGRMYVSAKKIADELNLKGYIITYQGAYIRDLSNGTVLQNLTVPLNLAKIVLTDMYENNHHPHLYINDSLYVTELDHKVYDYSRFRSVIPQPVGNLVEFINHPPSKIMNVCSDFDQAISFKEHILQHYNGELSSCLSTNITCEILNNNATKGKAIEYLALEFNIAKDEIMAIGDFDNDMDMLEFSGRSVAMGNALASLKSVASYVTDTVENDGAAKAIEKFILSS